METIAHPRNILVAVDVQNDFINGSLAVSEGEQVIAPINTATEAVRATDGTVLFTRDWHPAQTPHFETWPVHCVAGTEGADFHPELVIRDTDIVIIKGMEQTDGYSGWDGTSGNGTTLETFITPQNLEEKVQVFIAGLATDYCVKATALDIAAHYEDDERVKLYLLRDAVRAVGLDENDEDKALAALEEAKIHSLSTEEALALIERTAL